MTSNMFARSPENNRNPAYPKGGDWWTFPRIILELGTVVWTLFFARPEKRIDRGETAILPSKTLRRDPAGDGPVTIKP
jgi:hypothetical protein